MTFRNRAGFKGPLCLDFPHFQSFLCHRSVRTLQHIGSCPTFGPPYCGPFSHPKYTMATFFLTPKSVSAIFHPQESDFLSPVRKKHSECKCPDAVPFSVWFTTPAWNSGRPMTSFDWTRHMNKPLRKTGFSESHGYNDVVFETDELVGRYRGTEGLTVTPDQSRRGIREGIDTRIMISCTSPSPPSAGVRRHNQPFKTPASQKECFEKNPHITVR